jgi:hypothetical protein
MSYYDAEEEERRRMWYWTTKGHYDYIMRNIYNFFKQKDDADLNNPLLIDYYIGEIKNG